MSLPSPVPSSPPAPSQAEVQRAIASIPISLYEADWCPHCRRAKAWFAGQRLNVTDYDVDHDAQAKRALAKYNPRGSLPTIVIGDQVLTGFSEDSVAQTLAAVASRQLGARVTVRTR
jgi:glutaredoxin 3